MTVQKKQRIILWITQILFFCVLLIFLTKIFPLVPFDSDDWNYIGSMRLPIPEWGIWNPTRVLPETLMPLAGYISAYIIYPLTGHYISSITFVSAAICSAFVLLMLFMFFKLLRKRFSTKFLVAMASESFLFLSLFLLFKNTNRPSYDLLWAVDLSCIFFYIIPGLLNVSLLLYFESEGNVSLKYNKYSASKKGIIILAIYFAMFSCTQLDIILATYSFMCICIVLKNLLKKHSLTFSNLIKATWLYLIILFLWIIAVVFDMNGGRASNVSGLAHESHTAKIVDTFRHFVNLFKMQSKIFLAIYVVLILVTIIVLIQEKKKKYFKSQHFSAFLVNCFASLFFSWLYLMIAYIKAGAQYAGRPDATWPVWIFFLLIASSSFAFLLSKSEFIRSFTPLLLVLSFLFAFNFNYLPIVRNNNAGHSAATMQAVDNSIVSQVVSADKNGKAAVTVKVPLDSNDINPKNLASNWPHSYAMGHWLQNALYSHGIIRKRIQIRIKPDSTMNHRYYENITREQKHFPTDEFEEH